MRRKQNWRAWCRWPQRAREDMLVMVVVVIICTEPVTGRVDAVIEMAMVNVAPQTVEPTLVPVMEMANEVISMTTPEVTAVMANTLAVLTRPRTMDVVERKRALAKTVA